MGSAIPEDQDHELAAAGHPMTTRRRPRFAPTLELLVVLLQWLGVVLVLGFCIGLVISWGSVVILNC